MTTFPGFIVKKPRKKIAQRQLELRKTLWPDVTPEYLWTRQTHHGFTTLPRCMPLMMSIMDDLAKGQPVSMTYLELWCRTFDENFVVLSKPQNTAFHAGFAGQRAERTWRGRLTILKKLNFIDLKEGPSGPASYALLFNPYKVIEWHHIHKTPGLREDKWNALVERAGEVGDESLTPPEPPPAPVAAATPAAAPAETDAKPAPATT
ncbi:MAG: hypothetical protein WB764_19280 [Xanthobacteraceae bacterium]